MEVLFLLLGLGIVIALTVAVARWVLGPLDRAAKGRQAPVQFTLVDFLCLVLLAQVPTGLVRWLVEDQVYMSTWLLYGFSWIACAALWWLGIRTLSRAGIHHRWHRAAMLVLVLPVTAVSEIILPPTAVCVVLGPLIGIGVRSWGLAFLIALGLLVVLYAFRRYTRWLLEQSTSRVEDAHGETPAEETVQETVGATQR